MDVVGFDPDVIERWLGEITAIAPPLAWNRLFGGHSNLTYLLTDEAGRDFVIRRPPQGDLLPKAHDMWREFRIIRGLWPTPVPVAEPVAFCDDRAVAETHFYVMGLVSGRALFSGSEVARWLPGASRRAAAESFIDVLAALHSVDPDAVGLSDIGRPDDYVARQLRTWYGSWQASVPFAEFDDERAHTLHARLSAQVPEQGPGRIVHGDYGPHNVLFSADGTVRAVLDWEIATLGDPLADFAYSINAWVGPGEHGVYDGDPPTALGGFPTRAELIDRYQAATGADLTHLAYYRTFNSWKVASILLGVYARYRAGQKSAAGVDLDKLLAQVGASLDAAEEMAVEIVPAA